MKKEGNTIFPKDERDERGNNYHKYNDPCYDVFIDTTIIIFNKYDKGKYVIQIIYF